MLRIEAVEIDSVSYPFLALQFQHRPGADDALVSVQFCNDLAAPWLPAVFVSRTAGGLETWRASISAGGARQFLRLQVRLP